MKHSSVFHVVKFKLKRSSEKFSDDLFSFILLRRDLTPCKNQRGKKEQADYQSNGFADQGQAKDEPKQTAPQVRNQSQVAVIFVKEMSMGGEGNHAADINTQNNFPKRHCQPSIFSLSIMANRLKKRWESSNGGRKRPFYLRKYFMIYKIL